MTKKRLDQYLVERNLVVSRSQGESFVRMGKVFVDGKPATKPGQLVHENAVIRITETARYVSRAGHKLASVAELFKLDFRSKTVLDVGSSTGGFTDYALQHGATKVIAVDVGTDQLHPSLQAHSQIELHEKTDIRQFKTTQKIDIVVADVSFISLRDILPHVATLVTQHSLLAVMAKPQFEALHSGVKHHGVIKNDRMRRDILRDFEQWAKRSFVVLNKADSNVAGSKGNVERFYLLQKSR
ncbi:TlyA family RNA methyltransferase [Candidatus Saccharibacteria bacterium]|nr:TlyA family RNA methyltransferase [Candidatus Saccharibacteria bacterium]HPR09328.1 TlyA family RNA methyltransferase [Candidatus Saccharibacteria bacterium]